jgi:hypothetical protein
MENISLSTTWVNSASFIFYLSSNRCDFAARNVVMPV